MADFDARWTPEDMALAKPITVEPIGCAQASPQPGDEVYSYKADAAHLQTMTRREDGTWEHNPPLDYICGNCRERASAHVEITPWYKGGGVSQVLQLCPTALYKGPGEG